MILDFDSILNLSIFEEKCAANFIANNMTWDENESFFYEKGVVKIVGMILKKKSLTWGTFHKYYTYFFL